MPLLSYDTVGLPVAVGAAADLLGQAGGVAGGAGRDLGQRLEDRAEIVDGDALAHQPAQHLGHHRHRRHPRHHVAHQRRLARAELVEHGLHAAGAVRRIVGERGVILAAGDVRRHLRTVLEPELPGIAVVAPHELVAGVIVTPRGRIELATTG